MIPTPKALAAWRLAVAIVTTTMAAIIIAATLATPIPSPDQAPAVAAPGNSAPAVITPNGNTTGSR